MMNGTVIAVDLSKYSLAVRAGTRRSGRKYILKVDPERTEMRRGSRLLRLKNLYPLDRVVVRYLVDGPYTRLALTVVVVPYPKPLKIPG